MRQLLLTMIREQRGDVQRTVEVQTQAKKEGK